MKSIENIENIKNKKVILRLDLNVPIKNGKITDLISYYENKKIKGEFVIVVNKFSDN